MIDNGLEKSLNNLKRSLDDRYKQMMEKDEEVPQKVREDFIHDLNKYFEYKKMIDKRRYL